MIVGKKTLAIFLAATAFFFVLGARGSIKALYARDAKEFNELPDFVMTSVAADGEPRELSKRDLLGRVWVADFVFTHCGGPCPLLSAAMARLQKDLPKEALLVSFTVDPDKDTPRVLQEYARAFKADPDRWIFVRGDKGALYKLLYEGFNLPIAEDRDAPLGYRVMHSAKFVLVDAGGVVRGYYAGDNFSSLQKLRQDTLDLLKKEEVSEWPKKPSQS